MPPEVPKVGPNNNPMSARPAMHEGPTSSPYDLERKSGRRRRGRNPEDEEDDEEEAAEEEGEEEALLGNDSFAARRRGNNLKNFMADELPWEVAESDRKRRLDELNKRRGGIGPKGTGPLGAQPARLGPKPGTGPLGPRRSADKPEQPAVEAPRVTGRQVEGGFDPTAAVNSTYFAYKDLQERQEQLAKEREADQAPLAASGLPPAMAPGVTPVPPAKPAAPAAPTSPAAPMPSWLTSAAEPPAIGEPPAPSASLTPPGAIAKPARPAANAPTARPPEPGAPRPGTGPLPQMPASRPGTGPLKPPAAAVSPRAPQAPTPPPAIPVAPPPPAPPAPPQARPAPRPVTAAKPEPTPPAPPPAAERVVPQARPAGDFRVAIHVVEAETGRPMPQARLELEPTQDDLLPVINTQPDDQGWFLDRTIPPGSYHLAVRAPGFVPQGQAVVVAAGRCYEDVIRMERP